MPTDRCGFTADARGSPERGRVSCWRPTAGGADRCVWHREVGKSVRDLPRPDPGERLDGAVLRGLDLRRMTRFADCVLVGADFTNADVSGVDFSGADLRKARFRYASAHDADFSAAHLEGADVSDADLRGADLRLARLNDVNVENSRITSETAFGERVVYDREMTVADDPVAREEALEAAIRAYRTLENLSETNSLNAQASRFYRKAKDVRRRFNWLREDYGAALVGEASRWFTGYGNRPWRVILTSLGVILVAALLYPLLGGLRRSTTATDTVYAVGDLSALSLEYVGTVLLQSVFFSVITFTTLGYGNLEPVTTVGRYVAGAEALLGAVLMALLVAVLTRSTWLR